MTIHAEQVGRDLHITVEGIEAPFVIRPLPGRAGLQATDTYLAGSFGSVDPREMAAVMIMVVDGAVYNEDLDRWFPVPVEQQHTYSRIGLELSQSEAESVIMPAFFWQTTLGISGVQAYISGGEGIAGTLKAAGALTQRLALFVPKTSPNSGSGAPTSTASTPTTSSPQSGGNPVKRPQDRKPKKPKPHKA
ncbi:hypothetical protein [Agromyces badenianii]|uniref:hypothetical protein n=1 Tax=Agromyces badenianii TaxID=2080742 RepID=UPI000D58D77D|nr:hypothetical protein [Agromyces badenianii]PWC05411.1 hypothetical protein DCE94_03825 [Agromyces badenianii]